MVGCGSPTIFFITLSPNATDFENSMVYESPQCIKSCAITVRDGHNQDYTAKTDNFDVQVHEIEQSFNSFL